MAQTTTNTFYNREQEREAKTQGREKRRDKACPMLAAFQGSPMANPESMKDKAQGKCLICRQMGQWAKESPNSGKSPKMTCYKCHPEKAMAPHSSTLA